MKSSFYIRNLKKQGVDIDSLSDADKVEYLSILVNHAVQNISNSEFLQNLKTDGFLQNIKFCGFCFPITENTRPCKQTLAFRLSK